ncbi:MAG: hypothetical protein EOO88_35105 [Pedobacter sp.]|nr:MAG: hypothetical protein EOO88_35105 [Pedobacter sp.]
MMTQNKDDKDLRADDAPTMSAELDKKEQDNEKGEQPTTVKSDDENLFPEEEDVLRDPNNQDEPATHNPNEGM